MIASIDFWSSLKLNDVLEDPFTSEKVVDPPSIVSGSSIMEVGPVSVAILFLWMQLSVDIDKVSVQQSSEIFSFLISKTSGFVAVSFRTL